jgi:hypothetical protein
MPESFSGPVPEIGDRLPGGRGIESPAQVLGADHAEHFYIDHVRGYLVHIDD